MIGRQTGRTARERGRVARAGAWGWFVLALGATGGCSEVNPHQPPVLRVGLDECARCGMLISEARYAAGAAEIRQGRWTWALFDDVGCLLDHLQRRLDGSGQGASAASPGPAWVCDYITEKWVRAESAAYVVAEPSRLSTPMASGIVAFEAPGQAQAVQERVGGQVLDWAGVRAARARSAR